MSRGTRELSTYFVLFGLRQIPSTSGILESITLFLWSFLKCKDILDSCVKIFNTKEIND